MSSTPPPTIRFDSPDLFQALQQMSADELDRLDFGVIHFDNEGIVQRYNRYEQVNTGLRQDSVLGQHVFTRVAQCMNNFLVAERFTEARADDQPLDATIDYVLTWRMKPTPVRLRMLQAAGTPGAYVVLQRIG